MKDTPHLNKTDLTEQYEHLNWCNCTSRAPPLQGVYKTVKYANVKTVRVQLHPGHPGRSWHRPQPQGQVCPTHTWLSAKQAHQWPCPNLRNLPFLGSSVAGNPAMPHWGMAWHSPTHQDTGHHRDTTGIHCGAHSPIPLRGADGLLAARLRKEKGPLHTDSGSWHPS